ncbi:MAG: ComEC/Rec2 family competence protein [Planctomycetota bacterium]
MTSPPSEPSTLRSPDAVAQHVPAVAVLITVCGGIVADWYLASIPWPVWFGGAATCALIWLVLLLTNRLRPAAVALLIACGLTGAAWHHAQWSLVPTNAFSAYATDLPRPVRLRAIVDSTPVSIPAEVAEFPSDRSPRDRTLAEINVIAVIAAGSREISIPVTGRARLDVQGLLPPLAPGTEIEVWGLLSRPGPIRNPGGFDFKLYLRERGIQTLVRCEFSDCVQVRAPPPFRWLPDASTWQATIANRLRRGLSSQNAPLAIALLLGPRTDITPELKAAFLQSGMVHFLAISGINVGILVTFLWPWSYLLRLPRNLRLLFLAVCVASYVSMTDADPPILRAAVLVWIMLLSLVSGRPSAPLNHLAIAGLIILIRNPHDLFQVGAQLSFLAIVALNWLWSVRLLVAPEHADPLEELSRSWWWKPLHVLAKYLRAGLITTTAVWIFTLPLVLARFHLVSPVGFVLNVVLSLWVTLTLYLGYAYLACILIFPWLGQVVAPFFDGALAIFAAIIRSAAAIPGGHFKLSGPPDWWLAVFYVLILAIGSGLLSRRWQARGWKLTLAWCVAGLAWGLPPASNPGIRCTFLAVGHGAAILIELPNRQTILYDAGSLENGKRASQIVESAMLARGLTRLDALVISHADVDHFNAVPSLLENFSIGAVYVSPAFLDFTQPRVRQLCEVTRQSGVPLRLIWQEDRLRCAPDVAIEVLLPPAAGLSSDDNANSLVLSLRYAGRSLLLTGDLEKVGLQTLLQLPPQSHDILLAPHHGSLKANPPDLARWVMPRWVVVSGGGDISTVKLQQHYGAGAEILTTARQGAITLEISPQGEIQIDTQLTTPPTP